jgi:hypothetical protein
MTIIAIASRGPSPIHTELKELKELPPQSEEVDPDLIIQLIVEEIEIIMDIIAKSTFRPLSFGRCLKQNMVPDQAPIKAITKMSRPSFTGPIEAKSSIMLQTELVPVEYESE